MKPLPIRWRVSLAIGALLTAALAASSIGAWGGLREFLTSQMNSTLLSSARQVMEELEDPHPEEDPATRLALVAGYTGRSRANRFRVWFDGSDEDFAGSEGQGKTGDPALRDLPVKAQMDLDRERFFDIEEPEDDYRAVWLRRRLPQGVANVVIAASTHRMVHESAEFLSVILISGATILLFSVSLAAFIVWLGMRPVSRTARALHGVTIRNLDPEALEWISAPVELRPLVDSVRTMLARIEDSVARERCFVADASHELRTPIAVAKGVLQTIRLRPRETDDYCRAIDEALWELDRLRRRSEQLLLLARLPNNEETCVREPIDLDQLVVGVTNSFATLAEDQDARVVLAEILPTRVHGSRDLLEQLVGNLVDNALRHGPEKGTVTVSLTHTAGGRAVLTVHDEGGLIPPEAIPRLMDRFFRLDASRSRATGGAGLGLAIAREIAHNHGGDIQVSSDPASGTAFRVELPIEGEAPGREPAQ
jgi:signal transduction histidine kinase